MRKGRERTGRRVGRLDKSSTRRDDACMRVNNNKRQEKRTYLIMTRETRKQSCVYPSTYLVCACASACVCGNDNFHKPIEREIS